MKLLPLLFLISLSAPPSSEYVRSVEEWRAQRAIGLQKPDGWLSLAGLFWLKEGSNTAGDGPTDSIKLPIGSVGGAIGIFTLRGNEVTFTPEGKSSKGSTPIQLDQSLDVGRLKLIVIKRSRGIGIRVKDPEAPERKNFKGLSWFPVADQFRIDAKFTPFNPPKKVMVPDILGGNEETDAVGLVSFELDGKVHRLTAFDGGDELSFVFSDSTAGNGTYPSGRFLDTPLPKEGKVTLDFNRAYNPPCAYTKYATCPLPTADNFLAVGIEAGEKFSGHH